MPSVQEVPFGAAGFEQCPVAVSHVPATWHWSEGAHTIPTPGVHAPSWHVSPIVHALASVHDVPSDAAGFEHSPVAVSHVPATWH